jgi:hypothetical protein
MVKITKNAKNYLKDVILENKALGIALKIKNTGCSGKSYFLEYIYDENEIKDNFFFYNNEIFKHSILHSDIFVSIKFSSFSMIYNNWRCVSLESCNFFGITTGSNIVYSLTDSYSSWEIF